MSTPQSPIASGFKAETTGAEVLQDQNLAGKNIMITGGYSGLGLEMTRALSKAGAHIFVPVLSAKKAEDNLRGIANVVTGPLDLTDPSSIEAFAKTFVDSGLPLHILINSAGVMATPFKRDARGNEFQLSTNHLGHFQLTARLWPALVKAQGARVVALSSRGHRINGFNFIDPNFKRREYDRWQAYGQSKTANALFAFQLDRLGEPFKIRAFSNHPGAILTDLARHLSQDDLIKMGALDKDGKQITTFLKTLDQGIATTLWCATSPQLNGMGGVYCEDVNIAEIAPTPDSITGVQPWAVNPAAAERLWEISENLTGISFKP
jgi:NAD(P)-dependent dehydrogenase (short-subunit alcohol dehydrogenase family)